MSCATLAINHGLHIHSGLPRPVCFAQGFYLLIGPQPCWKQCSLGFYQLHRHSRHSIYNGPHSPISFKSHCHYISFLLNTIFRQHLHHARPLGKQRSWRELHGESPHPFFHSSPVSGPPFLVDEQSPDESSPGSIVSCDVNIFFNIYQSHVLFHF